MQDRCGRTGPFQQRSVPLERCEGGITTTGMLLLLLFVARSRTWAVVVLASVDVLERRIRNAPVAAVWVASVVVVVNMDAILTAVRKTSSLGVQDGEQIVFGGTLQKDLSACCCCARCANILHCLHRR